jgi:uncharacterized damage-inducible protein DinB
LPDPKNAAQHQVARESILDRPNPDSRIRITNKELSHMPEYGAPELANGFLTVRRNTLQIAHDIPEDRYDFVAAPGTKSVSELLRHLIAAPAFQEDVHGARPVQTLQGYDFGAMVGRMSAQERIPKTKTEILEALDAEGERIAAWLRSLTPDFLHETFTDATGRNPKTRLEALMAIKEHEMHHRGQLMLIERMVGVVPHLTRQREERARARQLATA